MRLRACLLAVVVALSSACLSTADLSGSKRETANGGGDGGSSGTCNADLMTDVGNCGACGHVCPNNANAYGTCAAGKCAIGCNTGFADCDANAANGCEVVLAIDANHCGTCGRSCNGADCSAGTCGGVALTTLENGITSLTIDGADIFCGLSDPGTQSGSIIRLGLDGQSRVDLVESLLVGPRNLALDANYVYFLKQSSAAYNTAPNGAIYRVSRKTATTTTNFPPIITNEAPADYQTHALQISGNSLYWITNSYELNNVAVQAKVRSADISLTTPTALDIVSQASVQSFRVDGADFYFSGYATAGSGLFHCPSSGCGASQAQAKALQTPTNTAFSVLLPTQSTLFVANSSFIGHVDKPSGLNYGLFSTTHNQLSQMATDGKDIFWLDGQSLFSCPISGCTTTPTGVDLHGNPVALALTSDAAYVAMSAGTNGVILKVVR